MNLTYRKVCNLYGIVPRTRDHGYWKDQNNVIGFWSASNIERCPTWKEIEDAGGSGMKKAVVAFGGLPWLSSAIGKKIVQHGKFEMPDGHFVDSRYEAIFDCILDNSNIPHSVHSRIGLKKYMCDFVMFPDNADKKIYVEIAGLENSRNVNIRDKYRFRLQEKIDHYKKTGSRFMIIRDCMFCGNIATIIGRLCELLAENSVVASADRDIIVESIKKCRSCDYEIKSKTFIEQFIKDNGFYPSTCHLREVGRHDIIYAILQSGGVNYWRNHFGVSLHTKRRWTDESVVLKYEELCKKSNKHIRGKELCDIDHGLYQQILSRGLAEVTTKKIRRPKSHWSPSRRASHEYHDKHFFHNHDRCQQRRKDD